MTNEQIAIQFLKKHRKYSSFKRQCTFSDGYEIGSVQYLIYSFLIWGSTEEGQDYWYNMHNKWYALCNHFSLKGHININNII